MAETNETGALRVDRGLFEGLIEALANKHSELELNLKKVTVSLPSLQMSVELDGVVSLSVHMREMSDEEKKALSAKNVKMMSTV